MDFAEAALRVALDKDSPQEELDKLGRWREEVRGESDGDR